MEKIENAKITNVTLSMADHGCLVFGLTMDGDGWFQTFGGWSIGHGYLGADVFEGSENGLECLMRIMDTVGVDRWEELEGQYCRIKCKNGQIYAIGNIIKDHWFDVEDFFKSALEKKKQQENEQC